MVTDAVVHPEPIYDWLPPDIRSKVEGATLAHAGMVAAAGAIFEDMRERGILKELVDHSEEYAPPGGQRVRAEQCSASGTGVGRGSQQGFNRPSSSGTPRARQYDADAGTPGAAVYHVHGRSHEEGQEERWHRDLEAGLRPEDESSSSKVEEAPGRVMGDLIRRKIEEEGYKMVVVGHR